MDSTASTVQTGRSDRRPGRAAVSVAGCLVVLVVLIDVVSSWTTYRHNPNGAVAFSALIAVETLCASIVGFLVVRSQPRNAVGWLLLAHGLLVDIVLGGSASGNPPGTAGQVLTQLGLGSWPLLYVCLAVIGYVFPDGHFLSRRWRRFVFGCLTGYAVFMVASVFDVDAFHQDYPGVAPPLSAPSGAALVAIEAAGIVSLVCIAASLFGAVVCARTRLRHATGDDRVRLLWVTWGALSIPGALALCWVDNWITGQAGWLTFLGVTVLGTVLPLSIGAAILRHRLFDIELVLSRTVTYGVLTVAVILTYAVVLQGLGAIVDNNGAAGLVAVGLVAVAIEPVHARLRRAVERRVYGDRSDPYAALRRLSERLEATVAPEQVIETVTASVREAVRVQRVAVELQREAVGEPDPTLGSNGHEPAVRVPLIYQGSRLGDLVVDVPTGRTLTLADWRLLDDLARQSAVVINAVHLTLDLQRSRAQLVSAQEEERRRLRRDLHDGLGPSLAAMVLKLNAASSLARDPAQKRLLDEVRAESKAAIGEIRRLVDDLRPPALDEVGLLGALRQRAASLSRPNGATELGRSVVLDVDGPDQTGPLPAAVEVAAYRIATEAMTNVVRHSGAARCLVTVTVNGALELSVADNGSRPWDNAREGVGLASMRERAAELGGTCHISRRADGGTVVHAILPLPAGSG